MWKSPHHTVAIDDGLRRTVEQAVGTLISSDTMTNNFQVVHDKILAQTSGCGLAQAGKSE